jgi:hypothetical protein
MPPLSFFVHKLTYYDIVGGIYSKNGHEGHIFNKRAAKMTLPKKDF